MLKPLDFSKEDLCVCVCDKVFVHFQPSYVCLLTVATYTFTIDTFITTLVFGANLTSWLRERSIFLHYTPTKTNVFAMILNNHKSYIILGVGKNVIIERKKLQKDFTLLCNLIVWFKTFEHKRFSYLSVTLPFATPLQKTSTCKMQSLHTDNFLKMFLQDVENKIS